MSLRGDNSTVAAQYRYGPGMFLAGSQDILNNLEQNARKRRRLSPCREDCLTDSFNTFEYQLSTDWYRKYPDWSIVTAGRSADNWSRNSPRSIAVPRPGWASASLAAGAPRHDPERRLATGAPGDASGGRDSARGSPRYAAAARTAEQIRSTSSSVRSGWIGSARIRPARSSDTGSSAPSCWALYAGWRCSGRG
jgi:hypothetical protein